MSFPSSHLDLRLEVACARARAAPTRARTRTVLLHSRYIYFYIATRAVVASAPTQSLWQPRGRSAIHRFTGLATTMDTVDSSPALSVPRGQTSSLYSESQELQLAAASTAGGPIGRRSIATDIASALSAYSSRKQLRRFAAELGLQADDPTGMAALLALDTTTVEAALVVTVADDANRSALRAMLKQLAADGLPDYVVEHPNTLVERPTAADDSSSSPAKCAPPHCCVECHSRCARHNSTRTHTNIFPFIHPRTLIRTLQLRNASASAAGHYS